MTIPTSKRLSPDGDKSLPPARRRRRRRMILPDSTSERAVFLEELAHQTTPSFDFFLFSIIGGLILGLALLLDEPALFILATLTFPFMAPVLGLSLASVFGSVRFFLQSVGSSLSAGALIFLIGAVTGWVLSQQDSIYFEQAFVHTYFTWADFLLLTIGTILAVIQVTRKPEKKPLIASVALAYELFLPLGIAGFGFSANISGLWPDGLIVFLVHLAWSALIGTITFTIIGLRPKSIIGYTLGSTFLLISIAAVIFLSGMGAALTTQVALPTPSPTATFTPTLTFTPTITPTASTTPTASATPTKTLVPTQTLTLTVSPEPTPIWARIQVNGEAGAVIREDASFSAAVIKSLLNGMLVEIIPGEEKIVSGFTWVRVRMTDGTEGWIVRSLLDTGTPNPE